MNIEEQQLSNLYDKITNYLQKFPSDKNWGPHNRPIERTARPSKTDDAAIDFLQIKDENGKNITNYHPCLISEFMEKNNLTEADLE